MKIHKILLTSLFCLLSSVFVLAQDQLNQNQKNFCLDIKRFLNEEGYSPTINNSYEIKFKRNGIEYELSMDSEYKGPYFIALSAVFNMGNLSEIEKTKLYELENILNGTEDCVKVFYYEYDINHKLLEFTVESCCHNSDDFKYATIRYLNSLENCISDFRNKFYTK